MAHVYLVSPALVRKTEELLARVRRGPASEEYIHDWIARVDASAVGRQSAAGAPSGQISSVAAESAAMRGLASAPRGRIHSAPKDLDNSEAQRPSVLCVARGALEILLRAREWRAAALRTAPVFHFERDEAGK